MVFHLNDDKHTNETKFSKKLNFIKRSVVPKICHYNQQQKNSFYLIKLIISNRNRFIQ